MTRRLPRWLSVAAIRLPFKLAAKPTLGHPSRKDDLGLAGVRIWHPRRTKCPAVRKSTFAVYESTFTLYGSTFTLYGSIFTLFRSSVALHRSSVAFLGVACALRKSICTFYS